MFKVFKVSVLPRGRIKEVSVAAFDLQADALKAAAKVSGVAVYREVRAHMVPIWMFGRVPEGQGHWYEVRPDVVTLKAQRDNKDLAADVLQRLSSRGKAVVEPTRNEMDESDAWWETPAAAATPKSRTIRVDVRRSKAA